MEDQMNPMNQSVQEPAPRPVYQPKAEVEQGGGYAYQNPNPYQSTVSYAYQPAPKKSSNKGLIIAAIIAASVMFLCCAVIVAVIAFRLIHSDSDPLSSGGNFIENILPGGEDSSKDSALRDENAIYDMPDITTEQKKGEELSLVEINKKVKNSVVGILIAMEGSEVEFSGSGFIISEDGYIITNDHVIEGATKVRVVLSDGITEYDAKIVGEDERSDLAILKVEARGLSPAELGDSNQLEVGETVVAIGNPYGMELAGTVTNGIVSALNRKIEMNGSYMTLIQTNASINPGNSGGPLVNAYGQVVGITSSKLVATGYEGIGFAIPINHVVEISEELITYGYIKTRAYIGISGYDLTEFEAKAKNLHRGIYVHYVDPECDAAKKGLKKGDIIIGFNGKEIQTMAELNDLKDSFHPGDSVSIKIWRNGEEVEINITLTEALE